MPLRCFLFSSDEETANLVCQILAGLGVEGESCSDAVAAGDKIANQTFHIVIVDWDQQPQSGLLLTAARERKAAERPITLAIVSNDKGAPEALHAGANSILRRPIVANQVKDTLTTARDLLRAKQSAATVSQAAAAAAGASSSAIPSSAEPEKQKTLRAGEFLQSGSNAPGAHFITDSDVADFPEQSAATQVDPLKDLEPVAASVAEEEPAPVPASLPSEPRGLEWYLKARAAKLQPAQAPPPQSSAKPELLGYDQIPSHSATPDPGNTAVAPPQPPTVREEKPEETKEAELFAYIDDGTQPEKASPSRFRLGKRPILAALVLAAFAIAAAPQAPWHDQARALWSRGQHSLHAWLNPQPVTPVQAPVSHEDFGRAGDEYKLPVTETIPDATTDPSQVQVLPVIDPTAKKPTPDVAIPDHPAGEPEGSAVTPSDQSQSPAPQVHESQPAQATETATPASVQSPVAVAPAPTVTVPIPAAVAPPRVETHSVSAPGNVPSSLRSQMVTMAPEAGGNKSPDAAMPSIEPVIVPEASERALLTDQPPVAYPANAKGQKGAVVLQVLIGRDGTVQDAKFLQGSLAFARAAIDGVKEWKFKPYTMNGRPVSVQTSLTLRF
jgi:periplasmic protein TonB